MKFCKMCSMKQGVLMFLTFSVAPEDCGNDQESNGGGLHSCLCVWSPLDHQTIVHRCDIQVSGAGIYTQKMSKLSLSSQDLPYLRHPYLVNASVSLLFIIPTFFTVFLPSIPVELSAGVHDLIIYLAADKRPDTHESS